MLQSCSDRAAAAAETAGGAAASTSSYRCRLPQWSSSASGWNAVDLNADAVPFHG